MSDPRFLTIFVAFRLLLLLVPALLYLQLTNGAEIINPDPIVISDIKGKTACARVCL